MTKYLKKRTTKTKYRKNYKNYKNKKTRKQRGGNCYGRGVGSNNYEPNYSIYNTRSLQLFPYKL
jgi:hypothetical protein